MSNPFDIDQLLTHLQRVTKGGPGSGPHPGTGTRDAVAERDIANTQRAYREAAEGRYGNGHTAEMAHTNDMYERASALSNMASQQTLAGGHASEGIGRSHENMANEHLAVAQGLGKEMSSGYGKIPQEKYDALSNAYNAHIGAAQQHVSASTANSRAGFGWGTVENAANASNEARQATGSAQDATWRLSKLG